MYSSAEMAKKLGISVQTIRNWNKNGVLVANRTPTGRMFYTHEQYLEMSGKTKYKCTGNDIDVVSGKVVLITGGTGSLGNAITERICDYAKKVIIYSRDELKQANMRQKFAEHDVVVRFLIGDIRDKERLMMAMKGVDVCIHAACMKRIETCTYNPLEAIKSNIIGSMNVLEACIANKVKKTLFVSTDKACEPATMYGGAKFVSEQLFINGNNYSTRDCIFTITRYGNVFGSNGSVRHLFEKQAKEMGKIKITHKEMTRFFMSLVAAVDLNLFALNHAIGGEIFIPKLKGTTMMKFAETFAPGVPIEFIGLRGYEKIHERLISETEATYVVDLGKYYKIVPPGASDGVVGWDIGYPKEATMKSFNYSSNNVEQLTVEELKEFEK